MTIVSAVAIHPRSGEVWDELQKQLKKAIQIVKKHGGENVTLLVTVIGGQQTNVLTMLIARTGPSSARSRRRCTATPRCRRCWPKPGRSRRGRSTPRRRSNSDPRAKNAARSAAGVLSGTRQIGGGGRVENL